MMMMAKKYTTIRIERKTREKLRKVQAYLILEQGHKCTIPKAIELLCDNFIKEKKRR